MPQNARFWRNVALIGLAHVVVIIGLVRWSRETKNSSVQTIVWMSGGTGDGSAAEKNSAVTPKLMKASTPRPERTPEPAKKEEEERPVLAAVKSEIQLPAPKPSPTSTATASPARTPKPSPTPKIKATPQPTPKPKAKPTPKPSPKKMTLAKASPKPSPKVKPTPEETGENDEQANADAEKKKMAKAALAKNEAGEPATKRSPDPQTGSGKGTSVGAGGGHAGGAGGESQFGWYGSMLHDRFYSEWVQPTTIASAGAKSSALVKIRIEKDGRISTFEIIKPSGNAELDESVAAVAKRVTQVDPLPAGLGNGDHYDVKINFELSSEQ